MKIGILTSGGDAPGMNAAIRAAARSALHEGYEVYGVNRGYEGLIDADIFPMDRHSVADILHRGGTMLQTARSDRFMTEEGRKKAASVIDMFGFDALIAIGGDGTMRGAVELGKLGVNVMFIPGTIDNDLAYTDYTIGFDTAINTVLHAITNIRDTSSSHDRAFVIEVMGRHCGDIAIASGLAGGAEKVLIPEQPYDINELCKDIIMDMQYGKKHYIIIKAEGVDISSDDLAKQIQAKTGLETKTCILSYIQRGGTPTATDRIYGSLLGNRAVELVKQGEFGKAVGIVRNMVAVYPIEAALNSDPKVSLVPYDLYEEIS